MHTHRPPSRRAGPIDRRLVAGCRAAALLALAGPALAAADATPALPDTATGRVARQLLQQVDSATPAQLEQWLPGILSDTIGNQDKAAFVAGLVSAARDGGGAKSESEPKMEQPARAADIRTPDRRRRSRMRVMFLESTAIPPIEATAANAVR